jgi:hypothetical protein
LHALDRQPTEFSYRPEQETTPAVEQFHKTAENPYAGDQAAIEAGGPSLADGDPARAHGHRPRPLRDHLCRRRRRTKM